MKTLHSYLIKQVLATLLMTVAVFTFVLLLGNVLKEIISLLINRQATFGLVAEAIGLLIPFVLVFALPMGMLTAALLVFGRFSADQELTAVRSSGVSLVALITPILILSIGLCGVSAVVNMEIAPQCRTAYKRLLFKARAKLVSVALPEGFYTRAIPGYIIYVGRNDGHNLRDVMVYQMPRGTTEEAFISAARGTYDTLEDKLVLNLEDVRYTTPNPDGGWRTVYSKTFPEKFDLAAAPTEDKKPSVSDMSFGELREELRELDNIFSNPNRQNLTRAEIRGEMEHLQQQKRDLTMPIRVQMHRQVAVSFACFGFTLVGIPLGIRAHRRETNVGIFMALMLVLVYYSFIVVGQSLQTHPELFPHLILWFPNFLFQAAGAVMLWRANRGV